MSALRWGLVAGVAIAGAILGGLVVYEGELPFVPAGARPVVVRVVNEGPEQAQVTFTAALLETSRTIRSTAALAPEASEEFPIGEVEGQVSARVRVEWTRGSFSGSGERGIILEEDQCGRGAAAVAVVAFQTAQGVSFSPTQRLCE